MESTAQRLARAGVPMREFPQGPRRIVADTNLYELVRGRALRVYPDAGLRLAVARSVAVEWPKGLRIAKEKTLHKIDSVVALSMAALLAVEGQAEASSRDLASPRRAAPHGRFVEA